MSNSADSWKDQSCKPLPEGTPPMSADEIQASLSAIPAWSLQNGELVRTFTFKNYYQTVSFVNAAAWIAHREDHHPGVSFDYKTCTIRYSTHSVGGISPNDFICAARIDALLGADS